MPKWNAKAPTLADRIVPAALTGRRLLGHVTRAMARVVALDPDLVVVGLAADFSP